MAIIPMKQKATIKRPGATDDWGNVISEPVEITLKCYAVEETAVVQNQQGEEVVTSGKFYFDKLTDIRDDDVISYTNELGVTVERTPIKIGAIRMFNRKAAMTRVYV